MKKMMVVLLIAAVLAAGITVLHRARNVELSIEEILPEGALIYVNVSDVGKKLEEFKAALLWQNIRNIDVEKLMRESGLGEKEIGKYRDAVAKISGFLPELLLDKYFSREIALAVYPAKINAFNQEAALDAVSNIILVTRLKPEAEFIEFVSKLYNKANKKIVIKEELHGDKKDHKITIVELDKKLKICYVKIDDLLVVGLGKKAAVICIETAFNKNKSSLSQDADFVHARAKLPRKTETISYANLELLVRNLRQFIDVIPARADSQKKQLFETMNEFAGFKTVVSASLPGKISESRVIFIFNKDKITPVTAKSYSFKPQRNETIDFVPDDVIAYQWSNNFDTKSRWDHFFNQLQKQESTGVPKPASFEQIIENINTKLGISIEKEIIPVLGNEIGGFLSDIDLAGPFPIPKFVIFLSVKDKEKTENIISVMIEKNNIPMQSEKHKDISIKYAALPFGTALQPGYCFLDDYLLISCSSQLLKKTIDTQLGKSASLVKNENFKSVNFGLLEKNNSVSFLDINLLLERTEKICEWGVNWFSLTSSIKKKALEGMEQEEEPKELKQTRKGMDAALVKLYFDELVLPILEGLKTYKASGSRTVVEDGQLRMQSFCK